MTKQDEDHVFYSKELDQSTIEQTCLYNLEPIGIGSVFVESLTSYVSRLALAHCVLTGTLITKILAPVMHKDYLIQSSIVGGSRFYESSAAINSLRKEAMDWVSALAVLTSRTDLQFLTMLPWAEVFPVRNLVRPYRAWCSKCLSSQVKGQEYEPLIWNLQVVEKCPIHNILLEEICPICGERNFVMSRKHIPGYCNKCLGWLGDQDPEPRCLADLSDKEEFFRGNDQMLSNLQFLIRYPLRSITPRVNTVERINLLLDKTTDGNMSSFAKIIGKPKNTVWGWVNAKNKATMKDVFVICATFGITLQEFYFGEIGKRTFKVASVKCGEMITPLIKSELRELDFDEIFVQLEEYSHAKEPPSMRQVARKINVSRRTLYNHYPLICKDIAHRYHEKRNIEKVKRIQADCQKVEKAVVSLLSQGIYPSRRKVEDEVGGALLKRKEVRQFWNDFRKK